MTLWLIETFGLSRLAAKLVVYVGLPLLVLFLFYLALDAYGDARFEAGEAAADLAWIEAGEELERRSRESADNADEGSADRIRSYNAAREAEKVKIHEAIDNDADPLDVLF